MKLATVAFGMILSLSSFAAEINGIQITGLPTASKSYERVVTVESEVAAAEASVKAACLRDKANAETFTQDKGFNIVSSTGCKVSTRNAYSDMQGPRYEISSSFEVLFK